MTPGERTILPDMPTKARSKTSSIDLSAYVAGLSYGAGILMIVSLRGTGEFRLNGFKIYVLIAAVAIFIAAVLLIQRHMRFSLTANTFGKPQHLATDGIFRYSRNPIYVAFFLPLASLAVISLWAALAALAVYVVAMTMTVIKTEERDLAEKFGAEYASYKAKVPRWLF